MNIFLSFSQNRLWAGEDEYNNWYNNVHLDDVVSLPGFVRAQRFRLDEPSKFEYRHLAIYEIKTARRGWPMPKLASIC
jgi:hypothetical protein